MADDFQTFEDRMKMNASHLIQKSAHDSISTISEVASRYLKGFADGSWAAAKVTVNTGLKAGSEALDVINRYTKDVYDIGGYGNGDLTADAGSAIVGNSAMMLRNGFRIANTPVVWAEKGIAHGLYNNKRIKKHQNKGKAILDANPNAKGRHYYEILSGTDKKEAIRYKDRLAWNRYADNGIHGFSEKKQAITAKFSAGRAERMQARKAGLLAHTDRKSTFHPVKSTVRMVGNQSRKAVTKTIQGSDPNDITNKTVLQFYNLTREPAKKVVKTGVKAGWQVVFHPVKSAKWVVSLPFKPVQWVKSGLHMIASLLSSIAGFIASLPVVMSMAAVIVPIVVTVIAVVTVISAVLNFNAYAVPVSEVSTVSYAANAFIYEAKKRNWQDEAIIGVLAYILQEGAGMGTFSYENYQYIQGPSNALSDKTLDNEKWIEWLGKVSTKNDYYELYYKNNTTRWASIGLGLIQDSDVWNSPATPDVKEAANATRLIEYAEGKDKPWQDPETQMSWIFDVRLNEAKGDADWSTVDPTKDSRSAEEWCRRMTASIGYPGWSWQTNDASGHMAAHVNKITAATNYFNNYTGFSYWNIMNANLGDGPDYSNMQAWVLANPYAQHGLWGQCTWFAWGMFYQIYGFSPGFTGNGNQCVGQLVSAHPDKFMQSDTPAAGAVFSGVGANHVGIVLSVDGDEVTIIDGNYDGATNASFEEAKSDFRINTYPISQLHSMYGGVTFAVPKGGVSTK